MNRHWYHRGRRQTSIFRVNRLKLRILFLFIMFVFIDTSWAAFTEENNDYVIFDSTVLGGRGVDPKIAALFRHAPRFLPGETTVILTVNGNVRGRIGVRFDNNGKLCADRAFQRNAQLVTPPGYTDDIPCFDLNQAWPRADIRSDPGEGMVYLIVPLEALSVMSADDSNWQHGGQAGILNYDAQYLSSFGGTRALNFGQLGTEMGFNAGDWVVRSRQNFTHFNGKDNINHQAAFVQRSFVSVSKVLQAGQISLSNSLFGTGQVLGFQMFPELALTSRFEGAGFVEGIADTHSVVEIHQSGVLVYSTSVPAGPFRLQNFSLLNTHTDLDVTLIGSLGKQQRFIVPASTLLTRAASVSPGLSFGVGFADQLNGQSPMLSTLATGKRLTSNSNLNIGILGSAPYRAFAVNLETHLFDQSRLSLRGAQAHDARHGNAGTLMSAVLSHHLTERLSVNVNRRQQTFGYRELSDALQHVKHTSSNSDSRSRYQWGSDINWSMAWMGNFSLSWAQSTSFDGRNTNYLRGSWQRQFFRSYLGASIERYGKMSERIYVTFSMPLGEGRDINSYLNRSKRSGRFGIRYNERTSENSSWDISTDSDLHGNRNTMSGNVSFMTPISQFSAGFSHDTDNYTSWSVRNDGSMVLHNGGLTLSPYRVTDTFGTARVGEEANVRLDTPGGPVWTDRRGYAVLPSLNGYQRSDIQLDTRSLKRNIDIGNAWQEVEMARGAVGKVNFEVIRTRRVLVEVKMADGSSLPYGSSVFNDAGDLITVVGDDGSVFVPDATSDMKLEVQSGGKTVCSMTLALPDNGDISGLYERAITICK